MVQRQVEALLYVIQVNIAATVEAGWQVMCPWARDCVSVIHMVQVQRRFSDFLDLLSQIEALDSACNLPSLPPKVRIFVMLNDDIPSCVNLVL